MRPSSLSGPNPAAVRDEAAASTVRHTGPTAERYNSAVVRYLQAVVADQPQRGQPQPAPLTTLVADVMTHEAVAAHEDAAFKEIVTSLSRNRIRSVPVVDAERRVVGVVSASDLLHRVADGSSTRAHLWRARETSRAATARELMTTPAVTTHPDTTIVEAEQLVARTRARMLPVVDAEGVLVGVVTQADLLRVFLRADEDIREEIERFALHGLHVDRAHLTVAVEEGVVTLTGKIDRETQHRHLVNHVRSVAGVVDVDDQLTARYDDRYFPAPHEGR